MGMTRRTVLKGALAGAAAAALARQVFAQQMQTHLPPGVKPKAKGPAVFLDYDKDEIDFAYDQAPWAPNQGEIARRNAQKSSAALARLGPPRRVAYGAADIEKLDIYVTRQPNAPINVFIHGGAWRSGDARSAAYMSETFVDAGAHFVALDFNNVTDVGGNLLIMADQVRRAIAWVHRNAASFGGDANRVYVSGTSSGGHLAAVALTTEWQKDFGLPADTLKGGLCCSGMYDLYPVSLSARAGYVKFTPETIEKLSPQRHLNKLVAPVIIAHGTLETPEFQRQNREFAETLKRAGKPVTFLIGQGYNHFEMFETLGNPYGLLGRAMLQQMKLGPGRGA
ncbi:MAG TPA: alpha/beta hydrolase [Burkholderiales bacterium]|nr:alpha/beta hydrolase [Burkholderiales bacterium]